MTTPVDDAKIKSNAEGPKRVTSDGVTVEQHPLADQIAADKYLQSKRASRKGGLRLKLVKLGPGSVV